MLRRLVFLLVGLVVLGLPAGASAEGCSNEQFRTGMSANLPDCRAYEQVSPVDKNNGSAGSPRDVAPAWGSSLDGNKMIFTSAQPFGDAVGAAATSQQYLASRGAGGWSSKALLPPQAVSPAGLPFPGFRAFSSDLSSALLKDGGGGASQDDPPLVSGEPAENKNLFVRDNSNDSYPLVDVTPAGVTPSEAVYAGSSTDLSHVVFGSSAQLTPNAPAGVDSLYEWSDGVVHLVSVLRNGTPITGNRSWQVVSEDGSRVIFQMGAGIYLYEENIGATPVGGGSLEAASGDGSKVFLVADASAGLTSDTVPGSGTNLYEYDAASGRLTDLTPVAHAELIQKPLPVLAGSNDGSYVYFIASGSLAAGATAGRQNLYEWHEGVTTLVASAEHVSFTTYGLAEEPKYRYGAAPAALTPDGTALAFESRASLTGYDNTDANTGEADIEMFLYEASAHRLICASCNPSGARPIGSSVMRPEEGLPGVLEVSDLGAAPRYLSADGSRLFFNSLDALVPQDTNGVEDVYEYEGGQLHLISGGTGRENSQFADSSLSGSDVFFATTQQLVAQDQDYAFDVYDARVGGGFPAPVSSASCSGEACRAPSTPVTFGVPGSAVFAGTGPLAPAAATPAVTPTAKAKPKAKRPKRKAKVRKRKRRVRGGKGHSTGKRG